MAVNKVEMADGEVLVDLTSDSVTENDVLEGKTFHSADGEARVGKVVVAPIDDELSKTSENPVQNKVITEALEGKADNMTYDAENSKLYLKSGDVVLSEVEIKGGTEPYSYKGWLKSANIEDTFGSLGNVLASEITVRELMTKHASSDYLLEWIANDDIILDALILHNNAMKWIGLRDYICDKLMALDGVTDKFLSSDNWEYILKDHVPVMTSNTVPYGEAISISDLNTTVNAAYRAFDSYTSLSTCWCASGSSATSASNLWVGYLFTNPVNVKRVLVKFDPYVKSATYKIQGSNDGSTWTDLTGNLTTLSNEFKIDNNNYYLRYRLYIVNETLNSAVGIGRVAILQFYGRSLNVSVPTMTSNTDPYGKAIASDADSRVQIYNAFNKVIENSYTGKWSSNSTRPAWIGYKFTNPICVKHFDWYGTESDSAVNYTLQASNDGNNWADIQSYTNDNHNTMVRISNDVNNEQSYLYYRMYVSTTNLNRNLVSVVELNFYGVDYSEREFAEGSNIKYIYDHGLVLTPLSAQKQDNSMTAEIGDKQLFVYKNASLANKMASISTDEMIDLTPYKLVRFVGGDKSILSTATGDMNNSILLYLKKLYDGSTAWIGNKTTKDRTDGLDISSVNQSVYVLFGTHFSTSSASGRSIEEWWLE